MQTNQTDYNSEETFQGYPSLSRSTGCHAFPRFEVSRFLGHPPSQHQKRRRSEINRWFHRRIELDVVLVHGTVPVELRERVFPVLWTRLHASRRPRVGLFDRPLNHS